MTQPLDAAAEDTMMDEVPIGDAGDLYRTFTDQAIALIGSPTSDGRMLSAAIDLSFRSFPLPLMWCKQSKEGHSDSYTVGVIESARVEGANVLASGYLLNTTEADAAAYEISHGVSNPSVDLANAEWSYTDLTGRELGESELWDLVEAGGEVFTTFSKAELIGTTLVATPAFDTKISLNTDREAREVALVASAAADFQPKVYDPRLFDNPNLTGPTLPTMGEDGRIYGHLAVFGQCHRSIQTDCIMVPRSPSNYSHFHTSPALRLEDGSRLPVGRLTVGTGHADPRLGAAPAAAHYDNTGACFALVRVGEDAHGVWFSGVPAPWATPEQIEQGISSPLSGDWRNFGQGLDLIAALAVNTPGFAARGRDDDQGLPIALVASVGPSPRTAVRTEVRFSKADLKDAVREALAEHSRQMDHSVSVLEAMTRAEQSVGRPPTVRDQVAALLVRFAESDGSYSPPRSVQSEAKKALEWIEQGHAGDGFTATGRKRASDLARGAAVSLATVKRIANYLSRHEVDKKGKGWSAGSEGYPSPGRVAWAAWGGDAAKSWTAGILDSVAASLEGEHLKKDKKCDCWDGYERVPGTKPCAPDSCRKKKAK